ncbi:MAG: hypothetical protein NTU57_01020 [Candidatus Aenigmarchaeota archaeon]|nr:hypothetical protein [Candidatus Aenigmarchaeota archaeon]
MPSQNYVQDAKFAPVSVIETTYRNGFPSIAYRPFGEASNTGIDFSESGIHVAIEDGMLTQRGTFLPAHLVRSSDIRHGEEKLLRINLLNPDITNDKYKGYLTVGGKLSNFRLYRLFEKSFMGREKEIASDVARKDFAKGASYFMESLMDFAERNRGHIKIKNFINLDSFSPEVRQIMNKLGFFE